MYKRYTLFTVYAACIQCIQFIQCLRCVHCMLCIQYIKCIYTVYVVYCRGQFLRNLLHDQYCFSLFMLIFTASNGLIILLNLHLTLCAVWKSVLHYCNASKLVLIKASEICTWGCILALDFDRTTKVISIKAWFCAEKKE